MQASLSEKDWYGCAPKTDKLALPLPLLPCDLEQNDAARAGAVLAKQTGGAHHEVGLHGVRLRVAHQLGRQRAGGLSLLEGFPPHCLLPLARLYEPHLRRKLTTLFSVPTVLHTVAN